MFSFIYKSIYIILFNVYLPVLWIYQIKMLCYALMTMQYSITINSCYFGFITVSWAGVTGTVKKRRFRATTLNGTQQTRIFVIMIILIIIFSPCVSIRAETKITKQILTQVAPEIIQFELVLLWTFLCFYVVCLLSVFCIY